jgi:hypothetical protein
MFFWQRDFIKGFSYKHIQRIFYNLQCNVFEFHKIEIEMESWICKCCKIFDIYSAVTRWDLQISDTFWCEIQNPALEATDIKYGINLRHWSRKLDSAVHIPKAINIPIRQSHKHIPKTDRSVRHIFSLSRLTLKTPWLAFCSLWL